MIRRILVFALVALVTAPAVVFADIAAERWHDRQSCGRHGIPPEAEYADRSRDLCVTGRQAHRKGPFGLRGPTLEGRAAGWCGANSWRVEYPEPFIESCIPGRVAQLRERGYREVFWGVDGPGELR